MPGPYTKLNVNDRTHKYSAPRFACVSEPVKRLLEMERDNTVHPDGKAWDKCCCGDTEMSPGNVVNCAFADSRLTAHDNIGDVPFVCVHREDNGYLRVCAGWHACFGKAYTDKKS